VGVKAWKTGTDIGIPGAQFFASHENYHPEGIWITANADGIGWFMDVPASVSYLNTEVKADGYTFNGPRRVDVPQGPYWVPPFLLTPTTPPYPPPPTRAEAIGLNLHFQGLWVDSAKYSDAYKAIYGGGQYSQIPYFGSAFQDFYVQGEGQAILDQLKAAGDRHCMVFRTYGGDGYDHPNQAYGAHQLIPPANIQDDAKWREIIDSIITNNMIPLINVNGEGQAGFNDTMATFQAQCDCLRADGVDRMPYVVFLVSWDGAWPGMGDGWSVANMKQGIPFMRSCIGPTGYLGFMFGSPGNGVPPYLYVEDQQDYTKAWMDGLDIVFTTGGPEEAEGVSLANKAGYMVRNPNFSEFQPNQQTYFILQDCSRGPRQWLEGEYLTYQCNYDPAQVYKAAVEAARGRMQRMNIGAWA